MQNWEEEEKDNPWNVFRDSKNINEEKKKMIANSGLCVTAAIKAAPNSSLQTPAADTETGPLWWKLREVNSPQVCQLAKRNTSKSLRPAPLL